MQKSQTIRYAKKTCTAFVAFVILRYLEILYRIGLNVEKELKSVPFNPKMVYSEHSEFVKA